MHQFLVTTFEANEAAKNKETIKPGELYVGDVIQAAIDEGMHVNSVVFPEGVCHDIGTPDELVQAVYNNIRKHPQHRRGHDSY
jgi:glucose-1-phosphate thymidylyltransferase